MASLSAFINKRKKFFLCLCVNLFFAFTVLFFAPFELYVMNKSDFLFSISDVTAIMGLLALLYVLLMGAVTLLLPDRFSEPLLSAIFSLTLCCYIQGNFLNSTVGVLDGAASYRWQDNMGHAVMVLILWIVIFAAPFLIRRFRRALYMPLLSGVSLVLIMMQLTALITLSATTNFEKSVKALSTEGQFTLSSDSNVVVFILDMFDCEFVSNLYRADNSFFDPLDGFTYFDNTTSAFEMTRTALPYILTSIPYLNDVPYETYVDNAWDMVYNNHSLFRILHDDNYDIRIYTEPTFFGKSSLELIDNTEAEFGKVSVPGLAASMLQLTAFRCLPDMLKNNFWCYTNDVNAKAFAKNYNYTGYVVDEKGNEEYTFDDPHFYQSFLKNGITVTDESKCYRMYHLNGAHAPYYMDENAQRSSEPLTWYEQSKGTMKIVYDYLKEMKALGIYDNSVIILMADHGARTNTGTFDHVMRPAIFIKPMGAPAFEGYQTSYAPVEQGDIPATIIKELGFDYKPLGKSVFDFKEDEPRTRYAYYMLASPQDDTSYVQQFQINGNSVDINHWSQTDVRWERVYK